MKTSSAKPSEPNTNAFLPPTVFALPRGLTSTLVVVPFRLNRQEGWQYDCCTAHSLTLALEVLAVGTRCGTYSPSVLPFYGILQNGHCINLFARASDVPKTLPLVVASFFLYLSPTAR